ncbi:M4 family metallopeptidase [Glaciibacter superstes]|uniref:M4 family metallopeptidase n=1 Tax=Glaciibacter superstes TaxID=501023 RepID=UPI0006877157|nr:M4 family metallopeptidase [Glaciibacter superstes]
MAGTVHSPGASSADSLSSARCGIVPPYLLLRLARLDDPRFAAASDAARHSLLRDAPIRDVRAPEPSPHPSARPTKPHPAREPATPGSPRRSVSDAVGREDLPGRLVRVEGQPPVADVTVNEAYDGLGETYSFFWSAFERDSIDGNGLPLNATVHFGEKYDNAFWDGQRMVFGDGDGQVFNRFTVSLSVIGHELTHGVTQFTANLVYRGQSGALNESVSDVFGSLVEQKAKGQSTAEASWLIGEGLFTDEVEGNALRSMKAPGTAYNDDVLGKDPQPASMADYVETDDDYGGVHLNSGIPNRAFYLVADSLGGNAWDAPGHIWYQTLTGGDLSATVDFAGFAEATSKTAFRLFGDGSPEHKAVASAWVTVGVTKSQSDDRTGMNSPH